MGKKSYRGKGVVTVSLLKALQNRLRQALIRN